MGTCARTASGRSIDGGSQWQSGGGRGAGRGWLSGGSAGRGARIAGGVWRSGGKWNSGGSNASSCQVVNTGVLEHGRKLFPVRSGECRGWGCGDEALGSTL
eukprot:1158341-Pelagomonas_calceolata.AAC.9